MKLPECHTREKLATFNQLKIFLYTMAAEYAPLFERPFAYIEPKGYPGRAELILSGPAYRDRKEAGRWSLKFIAETKYIPSFGNSRKKHHIFLDYKQEFLEDYACCKHGPQRLIVFGAIKFFHTEAVRLGEFYSVQASGDWPHGTVGLGLYLAKEYPEIEICSVEQVKNLIRGDEQNASAESAAMMF